MCLASAVSNALQVGLGRAGPEGALQLISAPLRAAAPLAVLRWQMQLLEATPIPGPSPTSSQNAQIMLSRAALLARLLPAVDSTAALALRRRMATDLDVAGPASMTYEQTVVPEGKRLVPTWTVWDNTRKTYLTVSLIAPIWKELGAAAMVVDRRGLMMLKVAQNKMGGEPAQGEQAKVLMGLQPGELGALLASDVAKGDVEFRRAPSGLADRILDNERGTERRLRVSRSAEGVVFSVTEKQGETQLASLAVGMSRGDFEVFKTLAQYAIPRLLGYNHLFPHTG